MTLNRQHKMYLGLRGWMIPIPRLVSAPGAKKSAASAKAQGNRLSSEERRVHHQVVRQMARAQNPLTADDLVDALDLPPDQVNASVARLEAMKTFIYREDARGINWAYPLAFDDTGHHITADTGERFFAA